MRREGFLIRVLRIAVPVGLQSMLQSSFAMIDQLMVGQLGGAAVSAVEAAGRPVFVYSVTLGAVAAIAGIMISQYLGMEEGEAAERSLSVNLAAAGLLALVFMGPCLALPGEIVGLFVREDSEILVMGRDYLRISLWTCLPMGLCSILAVMIRCRDRAVWPLAAGMASAAVNTALNYALIFGHWGFTARGVAGAAEASVISQLVQLALMILIFRRTGGGRRVRWSLDLGRKGWRQYLLMLGPILVTELLWSLGQSVNTAIYGHLAPGDLAAMSMTGPVQGLFIGALGGLSQAAGILIGKRLGAGEYDEARREAGRLVWYGAAGSLGLAVLLICLRGRYVELYRVEPEIRAVASRLLLAFAVLSPVKVANMILGGGVVRSGGRTSLIMAVDTVGTWLVGVPLGLITAFLFRLRIEWVYFILSQEELVRLGLTLWIFRRGSWMNRLEAPGE